MMTNYDNLLTHGSGPPDVQEIEAQGAVDLGPISRQHDLFAFINISSIGGAMK